MVVPALPQHLALEVHQPVLPGAHEDAHYLVRDADVPVEELPERHLDLAVAAAAGHGADDEAHVRDLPVDVLLGPPGPLGRLGPLLGTPVAVVPLVQAAGHGQLVVKLLAEGVQLLGLYVLVSPLLPPPFQVVHLAVFPLGLAVEFLRKSVRPKGERARGINTLIFYHTRAACSYFLHLRVIMEASSFFHYKRNTSTIQRN